MKKVLNIGIVGMGTMGKHYAHNLRFKIPNVNLLAACATDPRGLEYAKKIGVNEVYDDYDKMLENKALDAVFVISSTDQHVPHTIKGLKAGLHVFSEKPLALNLEDCYEAQKVADEHPNQVCMVGFVRRFDASYVEAKKKIQEGVIGDVFSVTSQTADTDDVAPILFERWRTSGGIVHDLGIHDVDLIHWFSESEIKRVWVIGGAYRFKEFGEVGDADNVFAMCEMQNGTVGKIIISRTSTFGYDTFTRIKGTHGSLDISDPPSKNLLRIANKDGVRHECFQTFFERFEPAFYTQAVAFLDAIRENKKTDMDIQNATKATRAAVALTKSFQENRPVALDEIK